MEPYLVKCASCQSKIRVRNPNLIGKKVPCPKCNAEITVTPPQPPKIHVVPNDLPSVDSTALTKEGFADDALSGFANQAEQPLGAFENFDFSEVDHALLQQAQAEQTMQQYYTEQAPATQADMWAAPERAAPNDQWASKSSARSRQMLIVGFLGATSCLVAAIIFFVFLRWYKTTPTVADSKAPTVNGQNEPPGQVPPVNDSNSTQVGQATIAEEHPSVNGEGSESPQSSKPDGLGQTEVVDIVKQPTTSDTAHSADKTPNPSDVVSSPPAETAPKILREDAPPKVQELLKVIVDPIISEPEKVEIPDQPKVTEFEIQTGNRDLKMTPIAKLTELASQRTIWSLNITQRKLHDVVSTWNSVVGLPIEISTLSLAAANYDLNQRFDIELRGVSASAGVEQLAAVVGLKVENRENRFWLLYAPPPDEEKLPSKIKISDLITGEDQLKWLAETMEQVFPGTSSALSFEEGYLSTKGDQLDRLTWFTMVRMLENWRIESGLPTQHPHYNKKHLQVPFVTASKFASLGRTLDQVNSTAKPLAQLINQQCDSVNISCLVDWPALEYLPTRLAPGETKSVLPQTPRISVTFNRLLSEFLHELEFELGIVTVLVDQDSAIMTSRFAYRRMPQVFVIPSEGKTIEAFWSQYFRPLTPIDNAGISNVILRATPDGRFLIVKCCWPTSKFE